MRQSVETATADKAVEPAPALCDDMPDDFMAFVRLALNAVNAKLDSIVTLQCYLILMIESPVRQLQSPASRSRLSLTRQTSTRSRSR